MAMIKVDCATEDSQKQEQVLLAAGLLVTSDSLQVEG